MKKWIVCLIASALGMGASTASFGQSMGQGLYVGGSIGQASADSFCDGAAGFTVSGCDDSDTGWKVFAGYRFHRNFAGELSYMNAGEYTATVTAGATSATVNADATAWGLAVLGIYPASEQFELFGKLGFVRGETDANVTVGGTSATVGDSGTELHYGFGAVYNLSRSLGIRAEWENVDDADLSMLSVGIQYRF